MVAAIAITELRTAPGAARSRESAWRRALRALAAAVDRLAPPGISEMDAELPPNWFKYPPI